MSHICCGGASSGCCLTAVAPATNPEPVNANIPLDFGLLPKVTGMPPEEMTRLMAELFRHLMAKCERKNKAYAETDATADALNNFRQAAGDFGISMNTYAMILQSKHYRAWRAFVRTGEAPDEPFRILGDIIVYGFLMYCIGVDQGLWSHEDVMNDDD